MFQWSKKHKEIQEIKETKNIQQLQRIEKQLTEVNTVLGLISHTQFPEEKETLEKISIKQSKQNLMVEGILAVMEEQGESQEQLCKEKKEIESEKERLADCLIKAAEYLFQMQQAAGGSAWSSQIQLVRTDIVQQMLLCGIKEISEIAGIANPSLHEIIQVIPAEESEEHGQIKEVVTPGYIYKEEVIKRAKVMVYTKEEKSNV